MLTPEESSNKDKVVYVCFTNTGIWNNTAARLMRRYGRNILDMPLKERFEITYKSNETFSNTHSPKIIDELIRSSDYCYQFVLLAVYLNRKMLERKHLYFKVAIGRQGAPFDGKRLVTVDIEWRNVTQAFEIKSYSFDITKLKSPYTDHCYDYTSYGFMDRNDAIANCTSDSTHLSDEKVVLKSKYNSSNATLWDKRDVRFPECDESKFEVDCNVKQYLTQVSVMKVDLINDPLIFFFNDTDASFSIISKVKIDDIDYVTYILGAMGTWLGFSFIAGEHS